MFKRQIVVLLLCSVMNMLIGCTAIVNRSPDEFMKKPTDKIYGISLPVKIHSVKTNDGREFTFDKDGGHYDFKSITIFGLSEGADRVSVRGSEIRSVLLMEKREDDSVLVECGLQLFNRKLSRFKKARIDGWVLPVNRITFDEAGYFDEVDGIIKGVAKDGTPVEMRIEDVPSLRVKKFSYWKNGALVIIYAGIWVVGYFWKSAWE